MEIVTLTLVTCMPLLSVYQSWGDIAFECTKMGMCRISRDLYAGVPPEHTRSPSSLCCLVAFCAIFQVLCPTFLCPETEGLEQRIGPVL